MTSTANWEEESYISLVEGLIRADPLSFVPNEFWNEEQQKKICKTTPRPDYWNSVWGMMLKNPDIHNSESYVVMALVVVFSLQHTLLSLCFPNAHNISPLSNHSEASHSVTIR